MKLDELATAVSADPIDLGDGHTLKYTEHGGKIVGGIITHDLATSETGKCSGAIWFDTDYAEKHGKTKWTHDGNMRAPTCSPSFLCHCGDHGFIRNGKWVRA
jgi:hypothetical protein